MERAPVLWPTASADMLHSIHAPLPPPTAARGLVEGRSHVAFTLIRFLTLGHTAGVKKITSVWIEQKNGLSMEPIPGSVASILLPPKLFPSNDDGV